MQSNLSFLSQNYEIDSSKPFANLFDLFGNCASIFGTQSVLIS